MQRHNMGAINYGATTLIAILGVLLPVMAYAGDVLRVEEIIIPDTVAAGSAVPVTVRFSVVEAIRDGWRVSAELVPVDGGQKYVAGPIEAKFNSQTPIGATRSASLTVAVPTDAAQGKYRVILDHYDKVGNEWVHIRYVTKDGAPQSIVVGEIEIKGQLSPLAAAEPLRKLRPGEIHQTFEGEDFSGMVGGGEDLGIAQGWTWYSSWVLSGHRAAVNTNGEGTIYTDFDSAMPAETYKVFVNCTTPGSTIRLTLGDASATTTPLRSGWNEAVELSPSSPVSRLAIEALNKPGEYIIIDSVHVTNDMDAIATVGVDPARQFLPVDAQPTKTARTIWTSEYVQSAKDRMERYENVHEVADSLIARAREIAAHSDEELWKLLPDTSIKREYYVNQNKGCPICGLKIKEFDVYHPWIMDPFEHPYKMQCPVCKNYFPSNDFAAGEMTGGDYPDDGTGCKIGDDTYCFIGEYVHFVYLKYFEPYMNTLAEAVALTDDPVLAHKLGVMLVRAAQQYPNSEDRYLRTHRQKTGYATGAITDYIWSSYDGRNYGKAYDAAWPFLDSDEELLELARHELPDVQNGEDLRLYIEENILRRIGQMYCDGAIQGNAGYHQRGMAWLLLAMGDLNSGRFPDDMDLLESMYYRINGPVAYFPELLMRDGAGHESTGYNSARLNMIEALDVLERFFREQGKDIPRDRYPSVWSDPRFAAQFDYYTDYIMLDRWLPGVGDTHGGPVVPEHTQPNKLSVVSPGIALKAWQYYRTPKLARLAYGWDDKAPLPSLWGDFQLEELAASRAQAPDKIQRKTQLQDAYGLAFLRSGSGENTRDLAVWYGKLLSHAHGDQLNWELAGKGLSLLPDLGYPKSWEHAWRWESNPLVHNMVVVDGNGFAAGEDRGRASFLGTITGADTPPPLQLVEVEGGEYGTGTNFARRTLAIVDIDDEDFYTVDLYDVRAGSSHTLSYHGPQAEVTTEGVELTAQDGGTVAGPDIAYGQPIKDADGKELHTPLAHMVEVQRGEPVAPFSLDYKLGDEQDTHVRMQMFPEEGTKLALGTGMPPSQPDAYKVRYALQTREGEAPLSGRYVSFIEPYSGSRKITDISRLVAGGLGGGEVLQIATANGYDTLFFASDADTTTVADGISFTGRAALVRTVNDATQTICAYGFTELKASDITITANAPYMQGIITACDYDDWSITVPGIPASDALIGQSARIFNDLHSTMHTIAAVEKVDGGAKLTFATSAIVHKGIASGIGDHHLRDGAPSPWALPSFMAGTRLYNETGDACWTVANASGGWYAAAKGTRLTFRDGQFAADADTLHQTLTDANNDGVAEFTMYEYAPGDTVQIANFAWLTRATDGTWSNRRTPDVVKTK